MSLSISQQNSYLKKPLGQRTESNQNAGSSRTQVAQNLQSGSAGATRTVTLAPKKHSRFVAGQGNLDSRAARRSTARLQDVNKRPTQGYYDTSRNDYFTKQTSSDRSIWTQSQGYSNFNFGQMTGTNMFGMNGMNGMNQTGAMGMLNKIGGQLGIDAGTINTVGAIYNGVQQVGNIFGINPTQQLGSVLGSFGGSHSTSSSVSAGAKSAISSMSSASDAVSLKQAIEGAKSEQASLSQLAGQVDAKQSAFTSATNAKKEAEKSVSDKKQAVSTKEQSVKSLTTSKDVKQKQLDAATQNETKCSEAYDKAQEATSAAQDDVTSAQNELNSATTDEAKAAAQAKLTKAQAKLEKAKAQEAKAKTALDQATKDKEAAQEQLNKITEQLDKAQKELETSKTEYQEAEKDLKTKENALKDAESDLDKAKQAKQDYDALSAEITSQEARLEQLDNQEKEAYSDTTKAIKEREAKIGDKTDDKKLNKLKKEQNEHGDNIVKLQCLSADPTEIGQNGEELRSTILPSGNKVYYVGMNEVSEEEYNNHKKTP